MPTQSGLDHAFLEYIGVKPESQIPIRRFYLPMLEGCRQVVDLGCGSGIFVELMREAGIEAIGVDSDPVACQEMRERGLPVVEQDALAYLEACEESSLDGIYAAHLVEHMPYETVLEMIRLSWRALRPGGRLILATPNPRAPISHLELYHLHFGHEAFYHPHLLNFFMEYCGFEGIEEGENPHTPALPLSELPLQPPPLERIDYRREFPSTGRNPVRALIRWFKTNLFRFVVQPFLDDIVGRMNEAWLRQHAAYQQSFHLANHYLDFMRALNRPFECYVVGYKPPAGETSHDSS